MKLFHIALLCITILRVSSIALSAQTIIEGTVLDKEDQQPLSGAFIEVLPDSILVTSDNDGHFKVISAHDHCILRIRYLGYDNLQMPVEKGSPLLKINVSRSSATLNEILVSASPLLYKSDVQGSNFRLNPQKLKQINPLSTEEALRMIPGVNIVGDMGLSNRPNISIRGSWGRRSKKVLLLEDGTAAAPAPYIAPGAYYNPVSDRITAIEVYKGAELLRYGPNNMYGAINYITALPPQKPQLRLKLMGGQRNYATGLLSYGGTWNNLGALVEGVYKRFDGFTQNSSIEVLNLNAKIFSKLSENQSLYFKVSGQTEDNQASLSSQTPFTFKTDPQQNPLDADQFTMRRYGVDIIHKWNINKRLNITSKIYGSDFERDWWRQITHKVKASEVKNYLGEKLYQERYGYLENAEINDEDYVIVGRLRDGHESTSDSRWAYTVSGLKETIQYKWSALGWTQEFESGINLHRETFKDRFLVADNSRWSRNGTTTKDLWYRLWSFNIYAQNKFSFGPWKVIPIIRMEHINMFRQDLIAVADNPTLTSTEEGREFNIYTQFLPGISLDRKVQNGLIYGGIYQGMISPSKVFGFLVEQDGIITNPLAAQSINIRPELSWNKELGWQGELIKGDLTGQITYFHNTTRNFYAGGRNEVFTTLGKINVQGLEISMQKSVLKRGDHRVDLSMNGSWMKSKVLSGQLEDRDLFSQVIHSNATMKEFINSVNTDRNGYEIYIRSNDGETLLQEEQLDIEDFPLITRSVLTFGDNGIKNAEAPYTPRINASVGMDYAHKTFSAGWLLHYVGSQFTEFQNFSNESADGAIGQLPSYYTMDAYMRYHLRARHGLQASLFMNGKNLTNRIYKASRLNRATSGIFPGGFRQLVFGLDIQF